MQALGKIKNNGNSNNNNNNHAASSSSSSSSTKTTPTIKSKPKSIDVHGITINFPYEPYPCQEKCMSHVIKALHNSENALLESPTGTGKTLCLLCSALAWQEEFRRRHNNMVR